MRDVRVEDKISLVKKVDFERKKEKNAYFILSYIFFIKFSGAPK